LEVKSFIFCREVLCLRILNNPATIAVYQHDSQEYFSMIIILADIHYYAL
jgi:hypothetical protein